MSPTQGREVARREAGKEAGTCPPYSSAAGHAEQKHSSRMSRRRKSADGGPRARTHARACAARPGWRHTSTLRTPATLAAPRPRLSRFRFSAGAEAGKLQPPAPRLLWRLRARTERPLALPPREWRRGMGRGQPVRDTLAPPTWALGRGFLLPLGRIELLVLLDFKLVLRRT